jgi:hypothetical protein
MEHRTSPAVLTALLAEHRALEDRMRTLNGCPADVLAAGQRLLAFARQEDEALAALTTLMEPAVVNELRAEHEEISHDLDLLGWIVTTTPDSPDASALAESLARRMHTHVSRDGRLLARAVGLSAR